MTSRRPRRAGRSAGSRARPPRPPSVGSSVIALAVLEPGQLVEAQRSSLPIRPPLGLELALADTSVSGRRVRHPRARRGPGARPGRAGFGVPRAPRPPRASRWPVVGVAHGRWASLLPGVGRRRQHLAGRARSCATGRPVCCRSHEPPSHRSTSPRPSRRPSSSRSTPATTQGWTAEDSLTELAALATTAGAEVVGAEWQNRRHVDPNWYVGKGKAEELLQAQDARPASTILVADDELSPGPAEEPREPAQRQGHRPQPADPRHLRPARPDPRGPAPGRARPARVPAAAPDAPVDAPLAHAAAASGPAVPASPSWRRTGGSSATRIKKMKERVDDVRQQRETAARGRDRRLYPTVAIVGYTNAGKSTLLNALVGSEVARAEDKLFATLDPTSRQVKLGRRPDGDRHRHRRLHPQAAAPAGRRVPRHPRGGHPRRRPGRGRRRVGRPRGRAPGDRPDGPRRAGRRRQAAARRRSTRRTSLYPGADGSTAGAGGRRAPCSCPPRPGFGLDTLRAEMAALLASLWEDVDVAVPYAAGELLARVRERGTVDLEYGERDVRVSGAGCRRRWRASCGRPRSAGRRRLAAEGVAS